MNYNELHLGKNIEFLIDEKRFKKYEIAEALGITRQHLRQIEKSEDINTAMLKKIAFVLNVNICEFLQDFENLKNKHNNTVAEPNEIYENNETKTELIETQLQAYKNEIVLLKELIQTKDTIIKLLTKKQ